MKTIKSLIIIPAALLLALLVSCEKATPGSGDIVLIWGHVYDLANSNPIENICVALSNKDTTYTLPDGGFLFKVPEDQVSSLQRIHCIDQDGLENGGLFRDTGMELSLSPDDALWNRRRKSFEFGGLEIFMELFEPVN